MIIDAILSRRERERETGADRFTPSAFWAYVREESEVFGGILPAELDVANEQQAKNALCGYVLRNGYSADICDYIRSKNWAN